MKTGLEDSVVVVTGSSSGIGKATAIGFGYESAKVVVTYHSNKAGAEDTAHSIEEAGGEALVIPYDLNNDESIDSLVEIVDNKWGKINVLVNNAVQWGRQTQNGSQRFEDISPEHWKPVLHRTIDGPYKAIQAVLPLMRKVEWGRIVNVSSNLAVDGMPGSAPYASAKAGLHGLTQVLAKELGGEKILANVVMPGLTTTELATQVIPPAILEEERNKTPTGTLSTPEDIANLIVFLGSLANGNINGEIIAITGGI